VLIAAASGLIVLLGYFVELPLLATLRHILLRWAVLLAAASVLIGLVNLLSVHWIRVDRQTKGWPYSAVLIFFLVVSLALGLFFGPDFELMFLLFDYVRIPVETALYALMAVALLVAGFRMISKRRDVFSTVFIGSAVLVLLANSPLLIGGASGLAAMFRNLGVWVAQVWATAGARGVILGVALGATATGLRIIMGVDRPYGD